MHSLVDFLARDAERRSDRDNLPGSPQHVVRPHRLHGDLIEVRRFREGFTRFLVLDDFERAQQALSATHISDNRVPSQALQLLISAARSANLSFSITSRFARAAAHDTGLPPNVIRCTKVLSADPIKASAI